MIIEEKNNKDINNNSNKEFLFSCIMAIYNVGKYLEEAIESVVNQTLNFEKYIQLILVNDGSTDNCDEICLKYEKKYPENIIYIRKKNEGVSKTRNIGLKYAQGEYINFIDADDYFTKNTLNAVNTFFNRNFRQVDVATVEMLDFSENFTSEKSYFYKFYRYNSIIDFNNTYDFAIFNPGMIFIKNSLAKRYTYNENVRIGEDILYYYKILIDSPRCGTIKTEKYMHRIREGSATTKPRRKEDTIKLLDIVLCELLEDSKKKYGHVQQFICDLVCNLIIHEVIQRCLVNNNDDDREILIDKIKKCLNYIENENIEKATFISEEQKSTLLYIKENDVDVIIKFLYMPLVSIIIPAYNASNYLNEAIDSALAQTYPNIEIIVINDGSNDGGRTEKIAKSYGNKIRYYYKENGGVSTALNLGISKMQGDYFSWLSHDDKYYPDKIEKQINYLKLNNLFDQNVILYSDYDLMDNHSRVFATSIKNHEELEEKPEYALLKGAINGLSLLIPKKAFEECGEFNEELRCAQDYELWDRMQKKYKFIHQQEILVTTRLHNGQQGNTSPKMLSEGNELWVNLIKNVSKQKKEELEGTEYNFFAEMYEFLKTTPYDLAIQYAKEQMEEMEKKILEEIQSIKVSVIIPFYNRISPLVSSINSVLQQTHKNIEIILVDDGTTEPKEEIEQLIKANENIRYIKNKENKGVSYSRNRGIDEAKGEYIAFLDSDDCFKEDKIEKQLMAMYLRGYDFSHTSYVRKDVENEQIILSGELKGKVVPRIIGGCGIATPTVMVKTQFLRENNLKYDEKMELGEDVCFYIEALSKTELLGIEEPLTIVNTNGDSAAYNIEKQLKGLKTIIKYVLDDKELYKYNYEIGLLFKEYIRVCDIRNINPILYESRELKSIKESSSWKLTKPLRTLKNVINLYRYDGAILATKKILKKILRKIKVIK